MIKLKAGLLWNNLPRNLSADTLTYSFKDSHEAYFQESFYLYYVASYIAIIKLAEHCITVFIKMNSSVHGSDVRRCIYDYNHYK